MIHWTTTEIDGEKYDWASLDGEEWLPVSRPPKEDEEEIVRALFEGDGNFMPLRFSRGLLIHRFGADL